MTVYDKPEMLKRQMIGKSTVSSGRSMTIPSNVIKTYEIKKGDIFEWYPSTIEFPDDKFPEIIAIIIRRQFVMR